MQFSLGILVAYFILVLGVSVKAFDWKTGNSSVWLSAAAYCETNTYLTRKFKGYSSDFIASYVIDDKDHDVQVSIFVFNPG